MKIIDINNKPIELNQNFNLLKNTHFLTLNLEEKDFFYKNLTSLSVFKSHLVQLKINNILINVPLCSYLMTSNDYDYEVEFVSIENLLHNQYEVPLFNPFKCGMLPPLTSVTVENIITKPFEWIIPKVSKRIGIVYSLENKKEPLSIVLINEDSYGKLDEMYIGEILL